MTNLLAKQPKKEREITPQQEQFLENLFDNGGNVTDAALKAAMDYYTRQLMGNPQSVTQELMDTSEESAADSAAAIK